MTDLYTVDLDATPEDANWLKSVRTDREKRLKKSFIVTKGVDLSESFFVIKSLTGQSFGFLKPEVFKSFYSSKYGLRLTPLGANQSLPEGAVLFTGKRGGKYYYKPDDKTHTEPGKRHTAGVSEVPEATFKLVPASAQELIDSLDDWNTQAGRLSTDTESDYSTPEGKMNSNIDASVGIFNAILSHADHPHYNLLTYQDGGKIHGAVLFEERYDERYGKRSIHVNYLCSSPEVLKNKVKTGVGSSLLYKVFKFTFVENSKYDKVDLYPLRLAVPFYHKIGFRSNPTRGSMSISRSKALKFIKKYEEKYGVKIP